MVSEEARKPRLSIEIDPDLRRRLKIAAARRDVTIRDYVLAAVTRALDGDDRDAWTRLSEPSFARDWDAEGDEVYDRL